MEYNGGMKSYNYAQYKMAKETFSNRRNCQIYAKVYVWGWVIAIAAFLMFCM